MSDDETKKDETTEAEEAPAQDEGAEAPKEEPAGASDEVAESADEGSQGDGAPPEDGGSEAEQSSADSDAPEALADDAAAEGASDAGGAAEPNPEDDLPWKEKRRLERSRRPHEAGPQQTPEERAAARAEARKAKAGLRRKERAGAKSKHEAGTGTPPATREANAPKVRQGIVVSDKADKTITVRIDIARRHPVYEKVVRRSRTLHAHDERNEAGEGDVVRVVETRPLSKSKRWRLIDVVEKAR